MMKLKSENKSFIWRHESWKNEAYDCFRLAACDQCLSSTIITLFFELRKQNVENWHIFSSRVVCCYNQVSRFTCIHITDISTVS